MYKTYNILTEWKNVHTDPITAPTAHNNFVTRPLITSEAVTRIKKICRPLEHEFFGKKKKRTFDKNQWTLDFKKTAIASFTLFYGRQTKDWGKVDTAIGA